MARRLFLFSNGWLRVVWGALTSPFLYVVILGLVALRWTPAAPASDHSPGAAQVLYLLAFCAVAAALWASTRKHFEWHWDNDKLADRITNFIDFLHMARRSIVLITGSLNHNLYSDDRVLMALRNLPRDVRITVLHEYDLDALSRAFREELEARHAVITRIVPGQISHGMVIDELHCKIEAFGVDDGAEEKHVDYYPFDAWRARRALEEIAKLTKAAEAEMAAA